MSVEAVIFRNRRVIVERLEPFGFVRESGAYVYRTLLLEGAFELVFTLSVAGHYEGKILDREFGEVYDAYRVASRQGNFVSQVREAYEEVLKAIAEACFEKALFTSEQANRLATYLADTFGDPYDHPFKAHPDYVSYRVNGKWYAVIFPLPLTKLGLVGAEADRFVEVVNLKVSPDERDRLLASEGIYPSYHMSKKHWVSIPLDGRLSDDWLMLLLANSRRLVAKK